MGNCKKEKGKTPLFKLFMSGFAEIYYAIVSILTHPGYTLNNVSWNRSIFNFIN